MRFFDIAVAAVICLALHGTSYADEIAHPKGDIILSVGGKINNTNADGYARFDMAMLEELPNVDITTSTPWHDGVVTFSGVRLSELLNYVGAEGEIITAIALNDYEVEIPVSDAFETNVVVAIEINGKKIEVRDKGPIFIAYPYDSSEALQTQTYYARSAWQVVELSIR